MRYPGVNGLDKSITRDKIKNALTYYLIYVPNDVKPKILSDANYTREFGNMTIFIQLSVPVYNILLLESLRYNTEISKIVRASIRLYDQNAFYTQTDDNIIHEKIIEGVPIFYRDMQLLAVLFSDLEKLMYIGDVSHECVLKFTNVDIYTKFYEAFKNSKKRFQLLCNAMRVARKKKIIIPDNTKRLSWYIREWCLKRRGRIGAWL